MVQSPSAVEFSGDSAWNFPVSPQETWGPSAMNSVADNVMMMPSTGTIPQYAPANVGQKDTVQLVRALESHVAFIEGDPALQEDLELYYYRIVRVGIQLFSTFLRLAADNLNDCVA